jgi:DNA polymerase-3 subunit gamma/tau
MTLPLSLKYRPRTFKDLVGQKASRAVLAKICLEKSLPPTMIFAGVRGTGKTSVARIVARSINCLNPDRFEPCGVCRTCSEIDAETAAYVVEVDAASHGGVQQMREIIDDVMYALEEWRVVILDEAHSISREGFNALLKTLEEPPPRTVFVLVTTEPGKIPETIQARAMMFRFSKITTADLMGRLSEVAQLEGFDVEEGALRWIAEAANGGMRDALMMLDQLSRLETKITRRLCEEVFGVMTVGPLIEALVSGNPAKAVVMADDMVSNLGDAGELVDRMIVVCRDALVAKAGEKAESGDAAKVSALLGPAAITELQRKLWRMRVQIRQVGADDRAATAALVAECVRDMGAVVQMASEAAGIDEIQEALG